ncbi:hypothetical protein ACTFIY_000131 [Dictyostelium cf. discoideum]
MKFLYIVVFLLLTLKLCWSEYCGETYCVENRKCFSFIGCRNSTCLYETIDVDDEVDCTADTCSDRYGVTNTPNDSLCPPENLCDTFLCDIQSGCVAIPKVNCPEPNQCQIPLGCNRENGICEYDEIDCDDDNECTDDHCDPILGECVHFSNNTICSIQASNFSSCYLSGVCGEFGCQFVEDSCDDGNPCTDDYCDIEKGCVSDKNDWNCDSLNACSEGICTENGCVQQEVDCDDGNPCSEDICHPLFGCVSLLNNSLCTNGNKCLNSSCTEDGCTLPVPIVCDDNNPCSDNTCNPSTGCKFTLNNSNCNDGKKCTIDQCSPNGCTHTNITCPPKKVVDIILIGLICRNHYCDQSTGNCVPDMNSVSLLCI